MGAPRMHGHHHLGLTAASLMVAILASYTALDLSGRVSAAAGRLMGLAIAGMHYTGMAAMRVPAEIDYDAAAPPPGAR